MWSPVLSGGKVGRSAGVHYKTTQNHFPRLHNNTDPSAQTITLPALTSLSAKSDSLAHFCRPLTVLIPDTDKPIIVSTLFISHTFQIKTIIEFGFEHSKHKHYCFWKLTLYTGIVTNKPTVSYLTKCKGNLLTSKTD